VLEERIYIAIALVIPDALVRIISHAPDTPFYPLYDNRTQRLVVLPSLAVRLPRGVSLGIGFNYLAGLGGQIAASDGATRAIEARVDENIFSHMGVNAGIRWQATRDFAAALVYRQEFSVPFRTISRNTVAGQPINLDIDAEGLYTPHQLVLGGALRLRRLLFSLDLQWSHWSGWKGPYVAVDSELPLVGAIAARPPRVPFNDTVGVRGGIELMAMERKYSWLKLRAGYAFESQAAPADQPGVTNLLDGHKHKLAAGGGLRFQFFSAWVRGDLHGTLDIVQPHTLHKQVDALRDEDASAPGIQISNPGYPEIGSGGVVWALGFTITVETR
jgi:long-subunit fatty acid transport protein